MIKDCCSTFLGIIYYYFRERKQFVIIVSSIRSGSTLLKALLSEAPEIVHENEKPFYPKGNRFMTYYHFYSENEGKIVLLKKPGGFYNQNDYPKLPNIEHKLIILIRNPLDTVLSMQKMIKDLNRSPSLSDCINLWISVYTSLAKRLHQSNSLLIKYEDLIFNTNLCTKRMYKFVGSQRNTGTSSYSVPISGNWSWGNDDGGDKIKQLEVVSPIKKNGSNHEIVTHLIKDNRVKALTKTFGITLMG